MVLKHPQGHKGSEYVLSFEIGQREGGFYSGRTETPSTVLVYRLLLTHDENNLYLPFFLSKYIIGIMLKLLFDL